MASNFRTLIVPAGTVGVEACLEAIHELFEDERSVALVSPDADLSVLDPSAPLHTDEPTLLLLTSGSTGKPRAVEIPVSALAESAAASAVHFGNQAVWLTALPTTSMGGLNTLVRSALAGTAPVIWDGVGGVQSFSAHDITPFIEATRVGATKQKLAAAASFVPTQLHRMLQNLETTTALAALDYVLIGGGALSEDDAAIANAAGIRIVRTYGATETCGGCVYDGIPLEEVEIEIDESGRIRVFGPMLAHSYRDGEVIAADGWLSSDIGEITNGRLHVLGRIDDQVKVGGQLVNLLTLTQQAKNITDVADAFAVAIDSSEYGFVPVVVYSGIAKENSVAEILRSDIGRVPLKVVAMESIPFLENGKPDRQAIKTFLKELSL